MASQLLLCAFAVSDSALLRAGVARRLAFRALAVLILIQGCKSPPTTVTITTLPEVSPGGPDTAGTISGHVYGASSGDKLIVVARAGEWWVQPDVHTPFTSIALDGTWTAKTHLGREYGAMLVSERFKPSEHVPNLPSRGEGVLALATSPGAPNPIEAVDHPAKPLLFGGYNWRNYFHVASLHSIYRYYLPENAEVDTNGALHLHIRTSGTEHTCSLVSPGQTLGYGRYSFGLVVPADIDPAAELNIFTSNDLESPGEHREIEFHLSRWGDPQNANAEYVIQPDHVAGNVHHFQLEPGAITTELHWSRGRADFNSSLAKSGKSVTRWSFTSGVPTYSNQRLYVSFCPFPYPRFPFSREAEVVLNHFEFLP